MRSKSLFQLGINPKDVYCFETETNKYKLSNGLGITEPVPRSIPPRKRQNKLIFGLGF
jgi:hypothetical protein